MSASEWLWSAVLWSGGSETWASAVIAAGNEKDANDT